jgi:hypothetical protein
MMDVLVDMKSTLQTLVGLISTQATSSGMAEHDQQYVVCATFSIIIKQYTYLVFITTHSCS